MDSKKPQKSNAPAAKSRRRRRPKTKFPDLHAILAAFGEASALVSVSLASLRENDYTGYESTVLRMAAHALDTVREQLDAADVQLARFSSKLGGAS